MKSPAFQWYPGDYLASQRVQLMTLEEEGAYIRLLCYCWVHGSIPADVEQCARLIGKGASTTLTQMVQTMFQPSSDPTKLVHDRLEIEREKQKNWREKSSIGGKKSAASRANTLHKSTVVEPPLQGSLENGYNQKPTLLSSSPSSSSNLLSWVDREALRPLPKSIDTAEFRTQWVIWCNYLSNRSNRAVPMETLDQHIRTCSEFGSAKLAIESLETAISLNMGRPATPRIPGEAQKRPEKQRIPANVAKFLAEHEAGQRNAV